ncbi:hypothetical protein D1872_254050 [compost metagenome]
MRHQQRLTAMPADRKPVQRFAPGCDISLQAFHHFLAHRRSRKRLITIGTAEVTGFGCQKNQVHRIGRMQGLMQKQGSAQLIRVLPDQKSLLYEQRMQIRSRTGWGFARSEA